MTHNGRGTNEEERYALWDIAKETGGREKSRKGRKKKENRRKYIKKM